MGKATRASAEVEPKRSLPAIEDAYDFCARDIPTPPVLVAGLLHRGSKLSLSGGSKAYKTWTLLNLAEAVAYGQPFLGCATNRSRVLVVNLEIQEAFCRQRLKTLEDVMGIKPAPRRLDVWNLRGYAASHDEISGEIIDAAGPGGYSLIVLDPIYKLYGDADENSARDVAQLHNSLERITVETGAAVAFSAHFSKGNQAGKSSIDRVSGSGVFARDPDSLLSLTAHQQPDCYVVEPTLRNFPPMRPFVVRWQFPQFVRDVSLNPEELKARGRPARFSSSDVLGSLANEHLTSKGWEAAAKSLVGCGHDTFYKLRAELKKQGKVVQDEQKKWYSVSAAA
jgi:hypothetical protein